MSLLDSKDSIPILGISDYLRIIQERWLLGLAIGILLAGLWSFYQMSRKPLYISSVRVLIEILDDKVVDIEQVVDEQEIIARSGRSESLLNQHLIRMKSREFRQYVIDSLTESQIRKITEPYRSAELVSPSVEVILKEAVEIGVDNRSLFYNVVATHRSSEAAAMIADTYAYQYIRYIMSDVGSSNDTAISFLDVKAKDLEALIKKEEQALQSFRKNHQIVSIEASRSLALDQLQQYQAEQTRLTVEQQALSALLGQIDQVGQDIAALIKIPEVMSYGNVSEYKQELDLAKTARERLSIDLLERHPRLVENQTLIDEYTALLASELDASVKSFKVAAEKLANQYVSNGDRILDYQIEVQRLEELAIEYDSIVRGISGNKDTLARIMQRLNETQIASQLSNANMRIIDSAYIPLKPSFPDTKKTVVFAVALFVLGFVGLPIGLSFLDDKLKSPFDVEQYVHKPLLGEIFRFNKSQQERVAFLVRDSEDDMLMDAFRSVYNNIKLNDLVKQDKKVQVITSTVPSEGKTMFTMNYGAVISQHGSKTLIIDCDLRKPRVHTYMRLPTENGLVHWFNSNEPIPNGNLASSTLGIQQVAENSFVLPAGRATNQSTEMVESERFKLLLQRLIEGFDHVLIDTPPIGVFPDAMFLANCAQEVIYISSVNRVSRKTVRHFVDQLDKTEANVCGLVLNGRKASKATSGHYYGYDYQYAKKYYGRKTGEKI